MARARDMSLFLHDSCTILQDLAHIFQEMVQETSNLQVIILAASLAKSCTISCKIHVQDSARIVHEKGHIVCSAMQVLHARFLHDLASSFFLGAKMESLDCKTLLIYNGTSTRAGYASVAYPVLAL